MISKSFSVLESWLLLTLANTKKAIWRNPLFIQNEAISLVAMRSHCQTQLKWFLVEWKLTATAQLNCKIYKSLKKCWKNHVSFCHQSSPVSRKAWMLLRILPELKDTLGKLEVAVNTGGHLIRVLNEMRNSDVGKLCPLWLVILKSVWHSIGNTL